MAIKKLSYKNLQELTGEMTKKFAQKTELGEIAALDKVGQDNLSEELKAVIAGKAQAATTLAGYGITDGMTATEIAAAISAAIAGADHLQRKIVASVDEIDLSAADAGQFIYMVPNRIEGASAEEAAQGESTETAADGNAYEEYMVINGTLERMGDWKVDLSDYAKTTAVLQAIASALTVEPTGSGNVVTGFQFNPETGKIEVEKGITALQESDFEEYSSQEIEALFT